MLETGVIKQRTLKTSVNCSGVGLHSGTKVSMTLNPAPVDGGITFKRTDIAGLGAVILFAATYYSTRREAKIHRAKLAAN